VGLIRTPDRYRLHPSGPGRVVDVGCGNAKYPGAIGIDSAPSSDADVIADLDQVPWPIEDDSADQIICQDVIEHLDDPDSAVAQMHRIGAPGCRIHLRTPHFSSVLAYGDPSHRHVLSTMTIKSFATPLYGGEDWPQFRLVHVTLDFWDPLRWLFIDRLANRYQGVYESLFAFRFPAMNIRAELEVVK